MRYLFQMVAFLAVLWMHAKMAATKVGFFSWPSKFFIKDISEEMSELRSFI